ncbi:MAG: MogA/MoaB family molybdenum cofactor biosynthesis protein [Actinobacteria bacterium]|nr:MogA/MoaB family molybdenum cofactor biosynthesis protein [Actinomycetota bacterium]
MTTKPWPAKVLTVSDGVASGHRDDASGRALVALLEERGFEVVEHRVVADGEENVSDALLDFTHDFAGLVVSTGGTGFAPRDQTPEGAMRVIDRHAPGLAEAMRAVNPLGRLSRGVAGAVGGSIIVTLPGSPRGCVEQLEAVMDVLPHALALLNQAPTSH